MTTTNKQRRQLRAKRDQIRRETDARDREEQRQRGLRLNYRRQLADAGVSDPEYELSKLETRALHSMAPRLEVLVAQACQQEKNPPPIAEPDPHFTAGDTFSFSTSPPAPAVADLKPPRRGIRLGRNPALVSLLALSLVGCSIPGSDD